LFISVSLIASSLLLASRRCGIQSPFSLSLELATVRRVALLEEPEVHAEHPAAIRQSARSATVPLSAGHSRPSLELIDASPPSWKDDELPLLSLYRLKLTDGVREEPPRSGSLSPPPRGDGDDLDEPKSPSSSAKVFTDRERSGKGA
jgi:hypothetical protein